MLWFVLLLILLGGGFYFYQRMMTLEQEIRAEQAQEKEQQASRGSEETSAVASPKEQPAQPVAESTLPADTDAQVENPVLRVICTHPGVVQADLYGQLPQLGRKQVQRMVRELVDAGKIKRERLGSSFKLYLV